MKAIVKEIQVCGGTIFNNLYLACFDYVGLIGTGEIDREKIAFSIKLPSGEVKGITIRQEDNEIVAYGDFDELPSFFDYSEEVTNEEARDNRDIE